MALVYAIVDAQQAGWGSAKTLGFFALAAALLVSFVVIETRTKAPLVRLSIFRIRSLLTANIAMFLAMSGMFAMFFFNTLYIQRVLGFGPLKAGVAFLPFSAGIMISAGLASQFAPRIGVRPVAAAGFVLSAAGLILLTQLPVHGSYLTNVLPSIALSSLGMGAVFMPLTLIATTGLDNADQGLASGLFNTSQQIGGALGLAVLSTLATSKSSSAGGSQANALVVGFHWAFAAGAVVMVVALGVMVVLLRSHHVARIEEEAASGEPVIVGA
jgi:predicted MFS family arabinose efflux permease